MKKHAPPLAVAATGTVFGIIGTSPIYALREAFTGPYGLRGDEADVLGILSLFIWSLLLVVTLKYLFFMLRADNHGEGGIIALTALASAAQERKKSRNAIAVLGLFGAALLFADSLLAPTILVLATVEVVGLQTPALTGAVLPVALAVVLSIFLAQPRVSEINARFAGGAITLWFVALAITGFQSVVMSPDILAAISPLHAFRFFQEHGIMALVALGAVILALTGAEVLYAEMGHYGKVPIRRVWFTLALPALTVNYLGQGAGILRDPAAAQHPFFLQVPAWELLPLMILAIVAAAIAIQSAISAAYSLTLQAMNLGYTPRFQVAHTSETDVAQVYIPWINRAVLVTVIILMLGFRSAGALASAYGIAVTATMMTTTALLFIVVRRRWHWSLPTALLLAGPFFLLDVAFFSANLPKIVSGGWAPLALGVVIFTALATWKRGREMLFDRLGTGAISAERFIASLALDPPQRVPGTAIFLTRNARGIPHALLHNIAHNKILHERVIFLTVRTVAVPHVPPSERMYIVPLGENFFRINLSFGFKDRPDVSAALTSRPSIRFDAQSTSFFLSRETLIPTFGAGMALWRERLFVRMAQNSASAQSFYNLPTNRVIELGAQIEL